MRKLLLILILPLLLNFSSKAMDGDTIVIRSHNNTHLNWYGDFYSKTTFPSADTSYKQILMKYTIGCPNQGCSDWDYTTKVFARRKSAVDTVYEYIEFARYITPYAGDKNFGFYREFWVDVTHYRSVFTDSVDIGIKFEGYQDGFTVSLDFYFIEGEPLRDAYKVIPLYYGGFPYGDPNNSIENYLPAIDVYIDSSAQEAAVEILQTGHGFGGNEDCAEFCEKYHYLKLDGLQQFSSAIWKSDCGMNPMYPQPGTWLYDRANWCPGEMVRPIYYDISNHIKADSSLNINLDMQAFTNVGNNNCSYNIAANLILYKNRRGMYDLELEEIVAPSADWENNRFNPTCGSPIVKIKNNGNDVTGFSIEYGIKNTSRKEIYVHTNTLKMHENITLELNALEMKSGELFYAKVIPNVSINDFDISNNEKENKVTNIVVLPNKFYIEFRSNNAAHENEYELSNLDGTFIHNKTNFNNNTLYRDTIHLNNGCYLFKMIDLDKDGLSFFANNDGSGYLRLKNISGSTIQTLRADFGSEIRYQFIVDSSLTGITYNNLDLGIQVYPNPSKAVCYIQTEKDNPILSLRIMSIDGKIFRQIGQFQPQDKIELNLSDLSNGLYIFEIESLKGVKHEKVEINR